MKKMNNKGFSLVELIVVIAIMAVLVGVLAPTLIKNVEKSRESTDLQNLDTIRGAVVTTLSDETVAAKIPASSTTYELDTTNVAIGLAGGGTDDFTNAFNAKIKDSLSKVGKLKSGNAVDANHIFVEIDNNSAVTVYIASTSGISNVAKCKITKSDSNQPMEYLSK